MNCNISKKHELLPYYEENGGVYFKLDNNTSYASKMFKHFYYADSCGYYLSSQIASLYNSNSEKFETISIRLKKKDVGRYDIDSSNYIQLSIWKSPNYNLYLSINNSGYIQIEESVESYIKGTFKCKLKVNSISSNETLEIIEGKFKFFKK
jgi:hypothetical protein